MSPLRRGKLHRHIKLLNKNKEKNVKLIKHLLIRKADYSEENDSESRRLALCESGICVYYHLQLFKNLNLKTSFTDMNF